MPHRQSLPLLLGKEVVQAVQTQTKCHRPKQGEAKRAQVPRRGQVRMKWKVRSTSPSQSCLQTPGPNNLLLMWLTYINQGYKHHRHKNVYKAQNYDLTQWQAQATWEVCSRERSKGQEKRNGKQSKWECAKKCALRGQPDGTRSLFHKWGKWAGKGSNGFPTDNARAEKARLRARCDSMTAVTIRSAACQEQEEGGEDAQT